MTPQLTARIFISYSHEDMLFAQRFVTDLRNAGATVWFDISGVGSGDFIRHINEGLRTSDWLVCILSPSAISSTYVQLEVDAALHRLQQGYMRSVIPVLAAPCPPNSIPPLWDALHRFDATRHYEIALLGVLRTLGLRSLPLKIESVISGKVLDVCGGSQKDGAAIIQYSYHGGNNQHWRLIPAGEDHNTYAIASEVSGKVIDLWGANMSDGARIAQYSYHGGANQLWRLVSATTDQSVHAIASHLNGKVLDVWGGSTDDGALVALYPYHGGNNQRWRLLRAD